MNIQESKLKNHESPRDSNEYLIYIIIDFII
jgi:hypothetical protein